MANMRVHELAKELGKTNKEVMDVLKKKNVDVQSHMAALSDDLVHYVKSNVHNEVSPSDEVPKKKKAAFVFRPQNSTQQITKNHQASSKVAPAHAEQKKDVEAKTSEVIRKEAKKPEMTIAEVKSVNPADIKPTRAIEKEGSVITEHMKKTEVVKKEENTGINMKEDSTKNKMTEMHNDNNNEENKVEKTQERRYENSQGGYQGQRRD
ncbi:MAG: translation initiation factor IF-2 N-terminal domain-containing protein, partial [Lachnospiraceae bacterium]